MRAITIIEILKIVLCIGFLLYACHLDLKARRVSNKVWKYMLLSASPLIFGIILIEGIVHIKYMAISFVSVFIFMYILFQFGAFGGADAKAYITIALIFPIFPEITVGGIVMPILDGLNWFVFTFSVFGNSVILTIIVPIGMVLYNIAKTPISELVKKPFFTVIGYKCPISKLDGHIKLMELHEQKKGTVSTKYVSGGIEITDSVKKDLENYSKKGLIGKKVWVTPGLPFIIPITAGFIAAVVFGDLIFYMVEALL